VLALEWGFTEKQLKTEFTQSFLEAMLDYHYEKITTQKYGNQ